MFQQVTLIVRFDSTMFRQIMNVSTNVFLCFLIISLFSCNVSNEQTENNLSDVNEEIFYLDNFISDSIDISYYDTNGFVTRESFRNNLSVLPNEFGELILRDIIIPLESEKFVCCKMGVDSVVEAVGLPMTPRFDRYNQFSDNSYLISISFFSARYNVNFGEGLLFDFENKLIETWYWPQSTFQFLEVGNKYPSMELTWIYESISLGSSELDMDNYYKDLELVDSIRAND